MIFNKKPRQHDEAESQGLKIKVMVIMIPAVYKQTNSRELVESDFLNYIPNPLMSYSQSAEFDSAKLAGL